MELEDVTPEALAIAIKRAAHNVHDSEQSPVRASGRVASFTMCLPNGQAFRVTVDEL